VLRLATLGVDRGAVVALALFETLREKEVVAENDAMYPLNVPFCIARMLTRAKYCTVDLSHTTFFNMTSNVRVTNLKSLTSVPPGFLAGNDEVEVVYFDGSAGCDKILTVGSNVLRACSRLRVADLSGLIGVKTIRDNLLWSSFSLKEVLLPPAPLTVGRSLLFGCDSLTRVDLRCLGQTTAVGENFLGACRDLKVVVIPQSFHPLLKVAPGAFVGSRAHVSPHDDQQTSTKK
jgi:hypothetical protein